MCASGSKMGPGVGCACVLTPRHPWLCLQRKELGSADRLGVHQIHFVHLTFPNCRGPGASPEHSGGRQGVPLTTRAPSTPRHLSPSSQEVSVEFVSKYRPWWPSRLRTAPLASRVNAELQLPSRGPRPAGLHLELWVKIIIIKVVNKNGGELRAGL